MGLGTLVGGGVGYAGSAQGPSSQNLYLWQLEQEAQKQQNQQLALQSLFQGGGQTQLAPIF
jgi:hypothetical protein